MGSEIPPPVVLWVKCGSGPVRINGWHLVAGEEDAESERREDVKLFRVSGKRSRLEVVARFRRKKVKFAAAEDDDDEDEKETEDKSPVKKSIRDTLVNRA